MASPKHIAEYIIESYTKDGAEIHSTGDEAIIVNLPPSFKDVTEFCAALYEEFGSIVDLEYDNKSLRAKVWISHLKSGTTDNLHSQDITKTIPISTLLKLAFFIVILSICVKLCIEHSVAIREGLSVGLMHLAGAL
jgi:hypothetical protein